MPSEGPNPEGIFRVLAAHKVRYIVVGGIAALMHDSPYPTFDTDICPASDSGNLENLTSALKEMEAMDFSDQDPGGLPFDPDARFLAGIEILNLVTDFGRLDVILEPAGSSGFPDLHRDAIRIEFGDIEVLVASLADVIRTKEATGRADPSLPVLRQLLATRSFRRSP